MQKHAISFQRCWGSICRTPCRNNIDWDIITREMETSFLIVCILFLIIFRDFRFQGSFGILAFRIVSLGLWPKSFCRTHMGQMETPQHFVWRTSVSEACDIPGEGGEVLQVFPVLPRTVDGVRAIKDPQSQRDRWAEHSVNLLWARAQPLQLTPSTLSSVSQSVASGHLTKEQLPSGAPGTAQETEMECSLCPFPYQAPWTEWGGMSHSRTMMS